jgi:predicted ribosomally synthesized peptide with SipW-like signal peptide
MTRLLKIVGLLSLLALCLSSGAFGYFSDQATSSSNTITAGTLYLGKDENSRGILDGTLKLEKMVPGEPPQEFRLAVKNIGNIKAYINALSAAVKESDAKFLANAVKVTCTGPGGEILYRGSLLSLDGNPVPTEAEICIRPQETITLTYAFQLDQRAGNWYKGKSVELSLTVLAGQNPGQKIAKEATVAGKNLQETIAQAEPGSVILIPAGEYGKLQVNRSDVTIKARDVVYDVVLAGLAFAPGVKNVKIQGFTVDVKAGEHNPLVIPDSSGGIGVTDNIFLSDKKEGPEAPKSIIVGNSSGTVIQRNDFSSLAAEKFRLQCVAAGKPEGVRYNLGLDLDPAVEAL